MHKLINYLLSQKVFLKKILPIELLRMVKKKLMGAEISKYRSKPIKTEIDCQLPFGVNLIGDICVEIGLGQSIRLLAGQLDLSNVNFGIHNFQIADNVRRNDHSWDSKVQENTPYGINLFHINPQEMGLAYVRLDKKIWKNEPSIFPFFKKN